MGTALIIAGILISTVGGLMFVIAAFRVSVLWGLGCLLVPLISLVFLILHWREAKKPFFVELAGVPFAVLGLLLGGGGS